MRGWVAAIPRLWSARLAAWLGVAALALAAAGLAGAFALADSHPGGHAFSSATTPSHVGPNAPFTPVHPLRIITLAPNATELVFAAGAGAQIVGTVLASDYPPEARSIPRVGDGIQFNAESILALKPDILVAWQPSGAVLALAAILAPLDIPVIYTNPAALTDIPREIRQLGERLGTEDRSKRVATELQRRIDALASGDTPLSVFIEVGHDPLYTLGNDPLINDLLAHCGGLNLYADRAIAAPLVSVENVLRRNPDVLIISPYDQEAFAARQAFWLALRLPAAQAGQIYAVDPDWLHRPGPRLIDAAEALCTDLALAHTLRP